MKWVTREHPKTDRIACPWLIRRFIDPEAEIVYVSRDQVLAYAEREGAMSFDAPGARYTHRDGKCSFETLIEEYRITDSAVALMAASSMAQMSQRTWKRLRSRPGCWLSRTDLRCCRWMTSANWSWSCRSMTPCTRGRNREWPTSTPDLDRGLRSSGGFGQ